MIHVEVFLYSWKLYIFPTCQIDANTNTNVRTSNHYYTYSTLLQMYCMSAMACNAHSDVFLKGKLLLKGMPTPGTGKRSPAPARNLRIICTMKENASSFPDGKGLPMEVEVGEEAKMVKSENLGGGKFGRYGGRFVPEILISCLAKLEAEFNLAIHDPDLQVLFNLVI